MEWGYRQFHQNVQSAFLPVENEKMGLVQNVQSAFRLVENEKMGLVQNVQSAFRLVENHDNIMSTFGPPMYEKM